MKDLNVGIGPKKNIKPPLHQKKHYIGEQQQDEMELLIEKYIDISNKGEIKSKHTDMLMHVLFVKYFDKMIGGIIYSQKYKFWKFAEYDDLFQEGRTAVLSSINKCQWKKERGSIFNFFTTVIMRNLINYTTKYNKNSHSMASTDISKIPHHKDIQYIQNFDRDFLIDDMRQILMKHFSGKHKFQELSDLLVHFFATTYSRKFIKRRFIEYTRGFNYSSAIVNTFFSHIKKINNMDKQIKILFEDQDECHEGNVG